MGKRPEMKRFQKRVADCIGPGEVPRIDASKSVADAIEVMRAKNTHCVYIESEEALVGVFTDRDLIKRVLSKAKRPTSTSLEDVMTKSPESLHPKDNVTYAINKMAIGGFRNIPIVDDGKLVAGLSVREVVSHIADVLSTESEDTPDSEWVDIGGQG